MELCFALLDLALDGVLIIEGVAVGPLLAAIRLTPAGTLLAAACACAATLAVAAATGGVDSADRVLALLLVAAVSALAVWISALRRGAERAARRLEAQHAVARVAARSSTIDEAGPGMLEAIGDELGWDVGGLWEVGEDARVRQVAAWRSRSFDEAAEFLSVSARLAFPRGEGLPGRVWKSGRPAWIEDIAADPNFPRAPVALAAGLRSGFAFPTVVGGRVVGVMEFFSCEPRKPDAGVTATLSALGTQVGQYLEAKRAGQAVRESRDRFDAMLESLADGVTVQDRGGALVYANAAAARVLGFETPAEVLAAGTEEIMSRFELFDEAGRPLPVESLPARRSFRDEPADPRVVRFRVRSTGEESWLVVKSTRIRDERGEAAYAVNIFEDISELKRSEIAQRFIAESGRLLAASLDYHATLARVTRIAVPDFADWCAVDLLDTDGGLERVSIAHADPERLSFAERLRRDYPPDPDSPRGPAQVARTGNPELYQAIPDELLRDAAVDDEHLELLRTVGMRSAMIVPIPGRGRNLGAMTFVNAETGRSFDEYDLGVAAAVAARAGMAIENARLYGERATVARTLQESLLPPTLPEVPGMDVAARYHAAGEGVDVGGDFYDLFELPDGSWAAVIGDVCGKGAEAAATTALARYTLRALTMQESRPAAVLTALNEALLRQRDDRQFCTVAYAHLRQDPAGGVKARIVCAGHPEPLVLRPGDDARPVGARGTLLGVVPDPELREVELTLAPGEALLLYTDGITEARVGDGLFGSGRLAATVRAVADRPAAEVAMRLEEAAGAAVMRDDAAILVLRALPAGSDVPALELRLDATPDAVREARDALRAFQAGIGEARFEDVRLMVSELVTNALRHGVARPDGTVGLQARLAGGCLRVEVSDAGVGFDPGERPLAAAAMGGWGLVLVESLASRWGIEGNGRTTAWFELDLRY